MDEEEIGIDIEVEEEEGSVEATSDVIKGDKGEKGDKGDTGEKGEQGIQGEKGETGETGNGIASVVTNEDYSITINFTDGSSYTTPSLKGDKGEDGQGTGDMKQSVYDADNNGIVDNAEKVNNHTVESDVPENAVFTDTVYDDTAIQTALDNRYTKDETYSQAEVNQLVSVIPKFAIEVVERLPTTDISDTTIYLLTTGSETDNLYTEYIHVNNAWEKLGEQRIDLTPLTNRITALENAITAMATSITTQKVIADEYDLHVDGNKGMWYEEDSEVVSANAVELATKETLQIEKSAEITTDTAEEVTEKGEENEEI